MMFLTMHVSRELCVLVYSMFELKTRTDGIILSAIVYTGMYFTLTMFLLAAIY